MAEAITNEEIMRVRRWECTQQGHDFEILMTAQHPDPRSIICTRCGEQWGVETRSVRSTPEDPA